MRESGSGDVREMERRDGLVITIHTWMTKLPREQQLSLRTIILTSDTWGGILV
jgi:hypothetical protein